MKGTMETSTAKNSKNIK